ncbi:hypothetical protein CR513_50164, partial [Mucuna pruriens]
YEFLYKLRVEALSRDKEGRAKGSIPLCIRLRIAYLNERIKVKLFTLEYSAYALVWWNQENEDPIIETWAELKRDLRERFYQGFKSFKEYHKEGEMCLMRAQVVEEVQDIIKPHHYHSLEDLVHKLL